MARVLVLLACLVLAVLAVAAEKVRYDQYRVYTVVPTTEEQVAVLRSLQHSVHELNFWSEISVAGREVDIMVPPHKLAFFNQLMSENQIATKLFIEDFQKHIDEENPNAGEKEFGWTAYYRLGEIYDWLDSLAATHQEVSVVVAGKSYEGREIRGVVVSFKKGNPAVFIEGGIHSREWIGPAAVTYMLNEILTSKDAAVRKIAESYDWHIFPVVNPDGYEYTHTTDRNWRKTRSPNKGSTCIGTDANRNFPTEFWGEEPGASKNPCDLTYGGSEPFSEIEAVALANYLKSVKNFLVYLSFHSYSQVVIYPLGNTNDPVPNQPLLQAIGDKAVAAVRQRYNTRFDAGNVVDLMYVCNGLTMDWAYQTLNIPIVFSFELRDKGVYGFTLPARFIIPASEETFDGVLSILEDALEARSQEPALSTN